MNTDAMITRQPQLGHSQKSRWQLFLNNSPVQALMKHLQDVDLHIIVNEK